MKTLATIVTVLVAMAVITAAKVELTATDAAHLIMGAVFGMAMMQTITAFAIMRTVEKQNKEREML